MGLFGEMKSTFKKREAAVVVEKLLEHQVNIGLFDLNPAKLANELVKTAWETKSNVFEGKFGQRPHKITVASSALANGIELFDKVDPNRKALILSLGNLLRKLETNERFFYPLNSLDHWVLEYPFSVFEEVTREFPETLDEKEAGDLTVPIEHFSWEEWLQYFKEEAGRENSQLEMDDKGICLIDYMEHEPLKRAYKNGVAPRTLGRDFAAQFDIATLDSQLHNACS